jgi:hypothetical protein
LKNSLQKRPLKSVRLGKLWLNSHTCNTLRNFQSEWDYFAKIGQNSQCNYTSFPLDAYNLPIVNHGTGVIMIIKYLHLCYRFYVLVWYTVSHPAGPIDLI